MDNTIVLVIVLLLGFLIFIIVMPILALAKASLAAKRALDLSRRIGALEKRLNLLAAAPAGAIAKAPEPIQPPAETPLETPAQTTEAPGKFAGQPPWLVTATEAEPEAQPAQPPPFHDSRWDVFENTGEPAPAPSGPAAGEMPAPLQSPPPRPAPRPVYTPPPAPPAAAPIDWEQFMGAKLFAWIGGIALFLGIAFFIKYSFEHYYIPPSVRAATAYVAGLGLLAGGLVMKRRETAVTAQTLSSTGILVLYGVTFACRSLYHFAFFTHGTTFFLMTAITAAAFLLSVNMNAMAVAVLGIACGFLTPVLLSTGRDAPLTLFGYIALLDIGLLAVALRRRWNALPVLGAIGTLLTQAGWMVQFFVLEQYFLGNKILVAMAVFAGFEALFLIAAAFSDRAEKYGRYLAGSALAMGIAALLVSFFFLGFESLGKRPVILFNYVLLVDLGLLAIMFMGGEIADAEAATGPAVFGFLAAWSCFFLVAGHVRAALGFYLVFSILHLALPVARGYLRKPSPPWWCSASAVFVLPFYFLSFDVMRQHPALFFGVVFLVNLALLGFAFLNRESASRLGLAGITTFLLLAIWTANSITNDNLYLALGLYFIFALLHSAAPVVLHKVRGIALPAWCNAFPAFALVLVLLPVFMLPALSLFIWPLVLVVDILAVFLAVVTETVLPIFVVLVLSFAAAAGWLFRIPAELTGLPGSLLTLGGFAVFFTLAAAFASRRLAGQSRKVEKPQLFGDINNPANLAVQIPALSAVLPFLLLIMVTLRLPLANPSPVFALALLLSALLLGLAKIRSLDALPAVALGSAAALEYTWHQNHFDPARATLPFLWYAAFYAVFTIFPFLFHRRFAKSAVPWAASALSGPLHFYLVYNLARASWPALDGAMGLLPAAFCVPSLFGTALLLKRTPEDSPARNSQLAWFGGVALFFITLIFPVQFHREWITIGWALEGAALCWLLRHVPHRGLGVAGAGLLAVAFCRLALNPAVLSYHACSGTPVWNWYLYTYGLVTACLFAGARLLAPPRNVVLGNNAPPLFYGMGAILAFLLVNIEIADFFAAPGAESLTFDFSGNFGRDMSYSIAWALFALLTLVIGISKRLAPVRYSSIGLLAVTMLKLFFHDLSRLEQLYRIAAFTVVAIIAIFASFLYQRFFGTLEKTGKTP